MSSSHQESQNESTTEQALSALRTLRDEIRLHIHLGSMEAREKWNALEGELDGLQSTTEDTAKGVLGKLMHGFRELRDSLTEAKH